MNDNLRCEPERTRSAGPRRLLALAVSLLLAAPLLFLTQAPAEAADANVDNCFGPFECLYFRTGFTDVGKEMSNPSPVSYDLRPITDKPADVTDTYQGHPWQGTFELVRHSSAGSNAELCLSYEDNEEGKTDFDRCIGSPNQRWYIEPVTDVITDTSSPDAWNPWWDAHSNWPEATQTKTKFLLRSAGLELNDRCAASTTKGLQMGTTAVTAKPCQDFDAARWSAQWNLYNYPADAAHVTKTDAQKAALTQYLLGSAIQHAMEICRTTSAYCSGQLLDSQTKAPLSEWDRISALTITKRPTPVIEGIGCAGGEGASESIYNGGTEPMTTSIATGGENSFETSVTRSLSVEVSASVDSFVSTSVTVSASQEWGKTWSKSSSSEQSIEWSVPPNRYATAVMSAAAIKATAQWRFGSSNPFRSVHTPWQTDAIVDMRLPYAESPNAQGPDTTIAVHNSMNPKSCSAQESSWLADEHDITVANQTTPQATNPIVGDVLDGTADPAWFRVAAGDTNPVNVAYQWFRVRAGESPEAIARATNARYTVSTDDVSDDDGTVRLFVAVTDVAGRMRFDSPQYPSLRTAPVLDERPTVEVGPTELAATVLSPAPSTGAPTLIRAAASAQNAGGAPTGSVELWVDGDSFGPPATLANGTAEFRAQLPRGKHLVQVTYAGAGQFTGARSHLLEVDVAALTSRTTLAADTTATYAGAPVTLRAAVTDPQHSGRPMTGEVEFLIGDLAVGNPVPLSADGTAELTSDLPRGDVAVRAAYSGSDVFDPSTSTQRKVEVRAARTNVTLTTAAQSLVAGSDLGLSAAVSQENGLPVTDGTVHLLVDGVPHGTAEPVGAPVTTWQVGDLAPGKHRLVLHYRPASDGLQSSVSTAREVEVTKAATALALTASTESAKVGDIVTFRVHVSTGVLDVTDGAVQLFLDGDAWGQPRTPDDRGTAQFKVTDLSEGSHQVVARYTPSAAHLGSSAAAPVTVVVSKTGTVATLTASRDRTTEGSAIDFRAVVETQHGAPVTTGTVRLSVDGVSWGQPTPTDDLGVATFRVNDLSVGEHQVTARYVPSGSHVTAASTAPVGVRVDAATSTVTLTAPTGVIAAGRALKLTAQVRRHDGTAPRTGHVQLYVDGQSTGWPLALDASGRVRWQGPELTAGEHTLMVRFVPDPGEVLRPSTSEPILQQVRRWRGAIKVAKPVRLKAKPGRVLVVGTLRASSEDSALNSARLKGLKVQLFRGDLRVGTATVGSAGEFRFKVKARKLAGGRPLTVRFTGSERPGIAPASSTTFRN